MGEKLHPVSRIKQTVTMFEGKAFKHLPISPLGKELVRALVSPDTAVSTVAHIVLADPGSKSLPFLGKALEAQNQN